VTAARALYEIQEFFGFIVSFLTIFHTCLQENKKLVLTAHKLAVRLKSTSTAGSVSSAIFEFALVIKF